MPTKYRGSQDEVRALNALIALLRSGDSFSTSLQRELAGKRVTGSQFAILEALLHLGPLCQGELSRKLLRSCGSMTSVVQGLEKRGLVERRRDGLDKRFVTVSLTEKGKERIKSIFPEHVKAVVRQFAVLTAPEQEELRRLCRKLGTSMERS